MAAFPTTVPVMNAAKIILRTQTLSSQENEIGKEIVKIKMLYAVRDLVLPFKGLTQVQARTLFQFFQARMGGWFHYFITYLEVYVSEFVGVHITGTTTMNLPGKTMTNVTVYADGSEVSESNYSIGSGTGEDGCDLLTWSTQPANGAKITIDFTGYLKVRCRQKNPTVDFTIFMKSLQETGAIPLRGAYNES